MTVYKYVNKTGGSLTVGATTVAAYAAVVSTAPNTDLDPVSTGVQFDKYVDAVLTNLSPFTTADVTAKKFYTPSTVAALGSAATAGEGAVGFATDASTTLALGIGTTCTGGGANNVPVYSNGTNWIYG